MEIVELRNLLFLLKGALTKVSVALGEPAPIDYYYQIRKLQRSDHEVILARHSSILGGAKSSGEIREALNCGKKQAY